MQLSFTFYAVVMMAICISAHTNDKSKRCKSGKMMRKSQDTCSARTCYQVTTETGTNNNDNAADDGMVRDFFIETFGLVPNDCKYKLGEICRYVVCPPTCNDEDDPKFKIWNAGKGGWRVTITGVGDLTQIFCNGGMDGQCNVNDKIKDEKNTYLEYSLQGEPARECFTEGCADVPDWDTDCISCDEDD